MTQEEQEEVKLLKELIADKSISADEREIYQDALDELMKSEKPKATTTKSKPTTTQRKTRTTPTKKVTPAKTKQTATDVEKAKAEIKAKTGKTEAECESIIEQYRSLRSKAQEGKRKAEQASADNKQRVGKLERKGDIIAGTNEKTADAVIESTAKDVADKIEKQVEAIEAKAEKEAKAEVAKDNSIKTTKDKKEAIDAIVDEKVKANAKPIVKRIVIDTSALLTSIATSLGKFDKDSQKEFLIKLRSDIDKLISKYAFGGMTDGATQVMNVQQSNMSSSSVNPSNFGRGGGVGKYSTIDLRVTKPYGDEEMEIAKFKGRGDAYISASALNNNSPSNYEYLVGNSKKYANGGGVGKPMIRKISEGYYEDENGDAIALNEEEDGSGYYFLDTTNGFSGGVSKTKAKTKDALMRYIAKNYKVVRTFANGGGVRIGSDGREYPYGSAWKLEHNKNNKNEDYEVPTGSRKNKYSVGGTLLSGMVGAYVGYQYGKKGKKAFKFEDGGVIGQEIVFDDRGEENMGVIKDITNAGDYIVLTENGRSVLAQRDRDVISLGEMAKAPMMMEKKKRFGFFEGGGGMPYVYWTITFYDLYDKQTFEVDVIGDYNNAENAIKQAIDENDIYVDYENDDNGQMYWNGNEIVLYDVKKKSGYNEFAKGGMTEHGLMEGDKIVFDHLSDDNMDIIDRNGNKHVVDLDKGKRYGNGGGVHTMPDGKVMLNSAHYNDGGGLGSEIIIKSGNNGNIKVVYHAIKNQRNELNSNQVFEEEKSKGKSVFLFVNNELYDEFIADGDENKYAQGGGISGLDDLIRG
jgi:hypothetical protein